MTDKKVKTRATAAAQTSPGDAVDAQLARYRSMRDFGVSAEPPGAHGASEGKQGLPFVIQKHAATRLHYDFRLGWNGVLKSWAVAKGPSYNVKDKRLAVQVEDHPTEYGGFEGIIPKGQYGGGTVMVWDQGTWEPQAGHSDVDAGLRDGSLKFVMYGTKMHGKWTLIRMGGKAATEGKPNWLLIKEHDEFERPSDVVCITEEAPKSAVTGRTLEEIAGSEDHVWNSRETAGTGQAWYRKGMAATPERTENTQIPSGNNKQDMQVREQMPEFVGPQLAMHAAKAPEGAGWLHELKLDGYRVQARKDGPKVQLLTRTGLDWTHRMKAVAAAVAKLPEDKLLLDGEVVVLRADGTTSFADLQAAFQEGTNRTLTYFVFDLLHKDGASTRGLPLSERKAILADVLAEAGEGLHISEHLEASGGVMFRKACELHAEGIISKRANSEYTSGRTGDWLKLKCVHEQEFVIGGFTLPEKGRKGTQAIGALLLGYYEGKRLVYAGRIGTGFTQTSHRAMRDRLEGLRAEACPFDRPPAEARRGAVWVRPELVAQVNFATWTADNLVRQASFKGMREDKSAKEVRREEAVPVARGGSNRSAKYEETGSRSAQEGIPPTGAKTKAEAAPVRLTHPDKVVDVQSGLTKRMLADYYWAVAERMLPHVADRPLSLVRCPEGSEKPCFFQKHTNVMLSAGIASVKVADKKTGKLEPYITLSTAEALAGLAQMGVLEVHPWGSRNEDLEHPDRLTIDLDPDEAIPWQVLAESAEEVRGRLKKLGLESFLKTTGGKGLHVVVPIVPGYDWGDIKQFAHGLVLNLEKRNPARYLTKMSKSARKGRIYLDYLRNERGATAVAAYSPRARAGMAVSLPLDWRELKSAERPGFRVADFAAWRKRLEHDPWKSMGAVKQALSAGMMAEVGVKVDEL